MQAQPESMQAAGTQPYIDQFERNRDVLPGQGVEWLNNARQINLARFGRAGFPTLKDEDWKYTSLKPITGKAFNLVSPSAQPGARSAGEHADIEFIPGLDAYRLVIVDGTVDTALSSLPGTAGKLRVTSLSDALSEFPETIQPLFDSVVDESAHAFAALNGALHQCGVVVVLEAGAVLEKPLEVIYAASRDQSMVQPRNLVAMGKNSKAQIIERHISLQGSASANPEIRGSEKAILDKPAASLCNSITEIVLEDSAALEYFLVQEQSSSACQVCGIWARQKANSRLSCHTVTFGGALVRNDLRSDMQESGAHCDMFGVYSLSGRQHVDNHTTMIHGAPGCTSNEHYKGVLDQRSRCVFHGRIKVEKDAQKTDAQQSSNTLLLSRDAEIDTKPQLEIYADDVKCSHGATIGQLDETSLFYLRSRGIDQDSARSMLTYAFVNEVLGRISIQPLRDYLEKALGNRLIREQQYLESA